MRYMLAMALALSIGIASMAPAAFAGDREDGGPAAPVSQMTVQDQPSDSGTIAGPSTPNQFQYVEHDRN